MINSKICVLSLLLMVVLVAPALAINEPTALTATGSTATSITWTWTADDTYYNTSVSIDGSFVANVTSPITGTQTYQATGLLPLTSHTISIESTDMKGNYSSALTDTQITSSSATVDFSGIQEVINATVTQVLPGIVQLVVGIVPVLVTLAVVGLITGIFNAIINALRKGF